MLCTATLIAISLSTATAKIHCADGRTISTPVVIGKGRQGTADATPIGTFKAMEAYGSEYGAHVPFAGCTVNKKCAGSFYELHGTLPEGYGQGSEKKQLSGSRRTSIGCVRFPTKVWAATDARTATISVSR